METRSSGPDSIPVSSTAVAWSGKQGAPVTTVSVHCYRVCVSYRSLRPSPLYDLSDLGLPVSNALLLVSQLPHLLLQLSVAAAQLLKHGRQLEERGQDRGQHKVNPSHRYYTEFGNLSRYCDRTLI